MTNQAKHIASGDDSATDSAKGAGGVSVLTIKMLNDYKRAGGRVVVFDKGLSFGSLPHEADAGTAGLNPFNINKP